MTSTINKTDGSILTVIADGTVDNSTNLILIGKNYAGYGDFLNENFVHLLENAASSTAPATPLVGQLWWDKSQNSLKVWTGTLFKVISSSTSQDTAPASPVIGDLWWDTFNGQLNVYNGTGWTLIGPAFTAAIGTSGTIVDSIIDENGDSHIAIKIFIEEILVAVISKDSEYAVNEVSESDVFAALSTIGPGINLASRSSVSNNTFYGTATDANTLATFPATSYARLDIPAVHTSTVSIRNNSGLTIGTNNTYTQTISGNAVTLQNSVADANGKSFVIRSNIAGTLTETLSISGNAEVLIALSPDRITSSDLAVATMKNIRDVGVNALARDGSLTITGNLMPEAGSSYTFGSDLVRFKTFYSDTIISSSVNAATIGNTGAAITGTSVSAATIGNTGTNYTGNSISLTGNITTTAGSLTAQTLAAGSARINGSVYADGYYFSNGDSFVPGVAKLNNKTGELTISGESGIAVSTSGSTLSVAPAAGYNGYGVRTISTSGPSGGANGDVWYQI